MKIGIVGSEGVVGSAVFAGLERLGHEVKGHDIILDTNLSDLYDSKVVFICVPTNQKKDGSCDTSIVESVVKEMCDDGFKNIIAIKSTVTPGTTARLIKEKSNCEGNEFRGSRLLPKICFVPEFLREKSAFYDFTEGHDVCMIGAGPETYEVIKEVHGHYPRKFVRLTPTEAELAKYFSNVFNAMRVTFANGFYEVCQKLGADYTAIKNAVTSRPTIQDLYLDCNDNWRGFGGYCLPKDSAAFAKLACDLGVPAKIFKTIVEDNKLYKPTAPKGMRL